MIKSQDDLNTCNDGKRSSDVLVATIEKCEKLQKQLDIAVNGLKDIQRRIMIDNGTYGECHTTYKLAQATLDKIEELNNDKAN